LNEELEARLKNKYPFSTYCECGDGWYELLDNLFENFTIIIKKYQLEDFCIFQIKEKFGKLSIYPNLYYGTKIDNFINELINNAEKESLKICEICGKEGKFINNHGIYMTRCEECGNK
jgi:hypothetical protein